MMSATIETEFKAEVDAATLAAVRKRSSTHAKRREPVTKRLTTTYFDTPDRTLWAHGVTLRVRKSGKTWVQTVKIDRSAGTGLHRVGELNAPVDGPKPRLSAIPDAPTRKRIKALIADAALAPVCRTEIKRTTRQLRCKHGLVELALDRGAVVAGEARLPIHEVELEVVKGAPEAVFAWAERLIGRYPARLIQPSKAARGFALAEGLSDPGAAPLAPSAPICDPDFCAEDAFDALLTRHATAIGHHLHRTFAEDEPEGPHQLRVALRRLRTLVTVFAPVLRRKHAQHLPSQARDLGRIVATLRDGDVMVDEVFAPALIETTANRALLDALGQWRDGVRARVRKDLTKARATGFAIDLMRLADLGCWRPHSKDKRKRLRSPARAVIAPALDQVWVKAAKRGDRFAKLSIEKRHALRKDLKAVRYAGEIAQIAYTTEQTQPFIKALKRLQNRLGYLNDLATLEAFTPDLPAGPVAKTFAKRRAQLVEASAAKAAKACEDVEMLWAALSAAPRFWTPSPA